MGRVRDGHGRGGGGWRDHDCRHAAELLARDLLDPGARGEARRKPRADVGFRGGVVPGNTNELAGLAAAGVLGFKCFLVDSGLDDFPPVGEADLRSAMREIARLGLPLLVHAEAPGPIAAAARGRPGTS